MADDNRHQPVVDDIVAELRQIESLRLENIDITEEVERLRIEIAMLNSRHHDALWDDTLIPIAEALCVDLDDEGGRPRNNHEMVDAIIKEVRRGRGHLYHLLYCPIKQCHICAEIEEERRNG